MKPDCNDCCSPKIVDPGICGCCEGVEIVTPEPTYNRPGLSAINYRIGSHASFLETMIARLTGYGLESKDEQGEVSIRYPLQGLTTRDRDDPSIAMLDAWATVADVLTFYQERIANEGYLRTATERRSVLELARLVGYRPRPGVSASVFLAYTLEDTFEEQTIIPVGSRAQSIPGPDELAQSFETSEEITARTQWNNLGPRMAQAQTKASIEGAINSDVAFPRIYLKGVATNIKANDAMQIDFSAVDSELYFVNEVLPDPDADRTLVTFSQSAAPELKLLDIAQVIQGLSVAASVQPANSLRLRRNLANQFALNINDEFETFLSGKSIVGSVAHASYSVLSAVSSVFANKLTKVVADKAVTGSEIEAYVMDITANLFGHNQALVPPPTPSPPVILSASSAADLTDQGRCTLALDAEYPDISVGARVAVVRKDSLTVLSKVTAVNTQTLGGLQEDELSLFSTFPTASKIRTSSTETISTTDPVKSKVTILTLESSWIDDVELDRSVILPTTKVYIQSSNPELADEPISEPICGGSDDSIELDGFYDGLEAGRWVIVSGERDDLSGARFSELAMLSSVTHGIGEQTGFGASGALPGETQHTFISLAEPLAYCFKRETVTIYGNVVKATNGETRHEVLGSGDGAVPFQSFELKQFPLTHVSASNPSGVDSTLSILVNDLEWHEADSLAELSSNDRKFVTKTDNESKTSVIFGNGEKGARLPSGQENIRAIYRNGIGKPGNVKEDQISLLMSKPLGVKEVINPLRASGGANRETRDQARKHVPLAVKALDRLVSVQDYEDFARIYAGIGKAHAVELSDGRQQLVHVTIAGAEDIPIDPSSDLFGNLGRALYDFGDPHQRIQLAIRELLFVVLEAGVAILPDYQWESVVADVRAHLLDAFSFENQELGQDVMLSKVIQVMQAVRGVAYVDVNAFGGIPEKKAGDAGSDRELLTPDEIAEQVANVVIGDESGEVSHRLAVNLADFEEGVIRPAQIAFLTDDAPATLILNQIEDVS